MTDLGLVLSRVTAGLLARRFPSGEAVGTQRWGRGQQCRTSPGLNLALTTGTSSINQPPGEHWTPTSKLYLAKTNTAVCREKIKQRPANIANLIIFRQVEIFHDHRYMAAIRSIRVTPSDILIKDNLLLLTIRADDIPHWVTAKMSIGSQPRAKEREQVIPIQRDQQANRNTSLRETKEKNIIFTIYKFYKEIQFFSWLNCGKFPIFLLCFLKENPERYSTGNPTKIDISKTW